MSLSIGEVVGQFQQEWAQALSDEALAQACQAEGIRWYQTLLNPITTLKLFLLQILQGNTVMTNLRPLSQLAFTASAYCQWRGKIPLAVCQRLLEGLARRAHEVVAEPDCWQGHRVYNVDGSSFSMPDTEALQAHFGQPGGQHNRAVGFRSHVPAFAPRRSSW